MIRLVELRREMGLSQRAMAKEFFVSQATFNNWENGNTQPSIAQLIAIAKYFGVSVDYLIGNSDDSGVIQYGEGNLSEENIKLLTLYSSLKPELRKCVLDLIINLQN